MKADRPLIIVILTSIAVTALIVAADVILAGWHIASIASAVISVSAAGVAVYQFREEAKISGELEDLEDQSDLQKLTQLQRDAVLRHKKRQKHNLEDRRLFIVVVVVAMIAVSETIACVSTILS